MFKKILSIMLIAILIISNIGICNTVNASDKPNAIHGKAHVGDLVIALLWSQWKFDQYNYNGEKIAHNTWSQGGGWAKLEPQPSTIDFQYRTTILTLLLAFKWDFKVKMLHYNGGRIFVDTWDDDSLPSSNGLINMYQIEYNGKRGQSHWADNPDKWDIVDLTGEY